jgi:arylsulfatase A-like enzyme
VILQLDWCTGEILKTLDRLNLTKDTLVIFTSDNGPVVDDGYKDQAVEKLSGHKPAGPLRGGKYSAFDAGTRVPFILRWPGRVEPGLSDALICQIDFMASFAALTRQRLKQNDAPDSFDVLSALIGKARMGRDHLVEHAGTLSLIKGDWKYIEPGRGPRINRNVNIELGNDREPQLYNLKSDIGERHNLASDHPELVRELAALLKKIRNDRHTRPNR